MKKQYYLVNGNQRVNINEIIGNKKFSDIQDIQSSDKYWGRGFWILNEIEDIPVRKFLNIDNCSYFIHFPDLSKFLNVLNNDFWNKVSDIKFYYADVGDDLHKEIYEYFNFQDVSFQEKFIDFIVNTNADMYIIEYKFNNKLQYVSIFNVLKVVEE